MTPTLVKAPLDRLTVHELRVALLAARGRSNRQAAEELFVSVNTVKSHISDLLRKMSVSNKAQAVAELMMEERFRTLYRDPADVLSITI